MTPRFLSLLLCALTALPLAAQTSLPPGEPLFADQGIAQLGLQTFPGAADAIAVRTVAADGPGFTAALRVETLRNVNPPFALQLRGANNSPLKEGDTGLIRFFARTISSEDENGTGRIGVGVRHGSGPGRGSINTAFSPPRDTWEEFLVPFRCARDYARLEAITSFYFGYRRQVIEIGGVEAYAYGKSIALADLPRTRFTYGGREADAAWRAGALARIEQTRKGDATVRVVDAAGRAVSGATVRLDQTNSAFEWGTALAFQRLIEDTPDNLIYRERALELFNAASPENDLKWPAWIGEFGTGTFNREQSLAGLRWLREHHLPTRGHVLVWPGWNNLPPSIRDLRGTPRQDEIPGLVLDHIRDIGAATREYLVEFDVLNEPYTNHDLMDIFGREIMVDWFKTAREAMPGVALYFNDFSNHDATTDREHVQHFEDTTRFLLEHGAPVDGLGLQAHIGGQPNAIANVLAVLDRYWNEFNLPIRITEFDIQTDDEELQADYTRDFLTLLFSHPAVVGVQHWGFWENAHWRPNAAMFRADWSEKPNAGVYRSLVLEQWRTHETATTDIEGRLTTRGFLGDYTITVEHDGKRIEQPATLRAGDTPTVIDIVVK